LDACKFGWAVPINLAFWLLGNNRLSTRGETVSYKRSSTGAGLPVVGGRTYGSRSARVFVGTKGDALLATTEGAGGGWIVTNLVGRTVLVGRALHFNARHLGIALQAPRAVADGRVVLDFAERIAAANGGQARVFALLRHAGLVIGTIVILEAFILETLRLRIAGPTDRTLANFTVTHGLAFGISAAWVPGTAEVGALVHDAGLVVKTFRVVIAVSNLGNFTSLVRIACGSRGTIANRSVIGHCASCGWTARVVVYARIDATS